MASFSLVAEVAVATNYDAPLAELHSLLEPYADRVAMAGGAVWLAGSAARYVGLVSSALGDYDEAESHFENAIAANRRMGALPWLARTQVDYARTLLARGRSRDGQRADELLAEAGATAQRLGMVDLQARVASVSPRVEPDHAPALVREGDYWTVTYGDKTARLHHMKGLGHLAQLLRQPGREFHVLDLVSMERGDAPAAQHRGEHQESILDKQARSAYQHRLQELSEDLEEAEAFHDQERAARAREEIDHLVDQLTGAVGLGGRDRAASTNAERARVSVSKAVKSAIERIAVVNPELGRHLAKTVRTGTFCAYDAESPVAFRT